VLYLMSAGEPRKADISDALLRSGGIISVQVLNEFTRVALRKLGLELTHVRKVLTAVRTTCQIVPLTVAVHDRALDLVAAHKFQIFDANIIAAAQLAGCNTVLSEDMQDGQIIDGLTIRNPYR
jgi:predicted nucleic acid-binding protein